MNKKKAPAKKKTIKKKATALKNDFYFSMSTKNRQWLKNASDKLTKPQSQILDGLMSFARTTTEAKLAQIFKA